MSDVKFTYWPFAFVVAQVVLLLMVFEFKFVLPFWVLWFPALCFVSFMVVLVFILIGMVMWSVFND